MAHTADPFRANPVLPGGADAGRPGTRTLSLSAALHLMLVVAALTLPARFAGDAEPEQIDIVFHAPDRERLPPPPEPEPEPEPVEATAVEPAPPAHERVPEQIRKAVVREEPPAPRRVAPEPAPTVARVASPPPAAAPERAEPQVARLGSFAVEPEKAPPASAATRVVASGRFGGKTTLPVAAPSRAGDVVARASFDGAAARDLPARGDVDRGRVTAGSFGAAVAAAASGRAPSGAVQQGGFGDGVAAASAPPRRQRAAPELDTPVEVLSKPKPAYTDEARERRIEGTVVLEVTFLASGRLRVHRVVEGLGHGLDEAARDAAGNIEFKPARNNGKPVDHTAKLRVVFKLA